MSATGLAVAIGEPKTYICTARDQKLLMAHFYNKKPSTQQLL